MVFISGKLKDIFVYFKKVPKWMCSEYLMGVNRLLYLISPTNSIVIITLPLSQLLLLNLFLAAR